MLFEGKQSKFENLVRAFSAELYRYAYWLCRDRFVAQDLVQETFMRAWQAWEHLNDERAAKAWLYTILRNEHARLFERKKLAIDDEQDLGEIPSVAASNPLAAFEIREAIYALPQTFRDPLLLQVLGGFSCSEIARLMSISEGAVMTRLTRARQALRQLSGWNPARKKEAS
ncbi:MAG: sigma-70 family RNA polymerase sigma factor [Betaproteobacteria bacterium]|nr:sigma-70 family RNA polymerase sigma factor [Betaproteobacteria bacterium]